MRPSCIFIICLVFFAFCSLAQRFNFNGKCCYSFSNLKIRANLVESYQATDFHCARNAIIFVTDRQKEICADPADEWVQRLMKLVDARRSEMLHEIPDKVSKVEK
ncbi:C-C motif chemokine 13-like [Danio aesculapii]|uniref:C-C motif chemokine 13-like n=1 Tax=Danio aesculapii TaxID=1142201 RepID=UPI0024C00BF3|nr:C-C motif chemokine 13-like [Danio aesculapii]